VAAAFAQTPDPVVKTSDKAGNFVGTALPVAEQMIEQLGEQAQKFYDI